VPPQKSWNSAIGCKLGPCLQPKIAHPRRSGRNHSQAQPGNQPSNFGSLDLLLVCSPEKPIDFLCVVTCILTHRPPRSRSLTFPLRYLPCRQVKSVVLSEALQQATVVGHCLSQTALRAYLVQSWNRSTVKPRARCLELQPCLPVGRNRAREMRYGLTERIRYLVA
jgi:hypothetical protein